MGWLSRKTERQIADPVEERSVVSIGDPAAAALFNIYPTSTGICVDQNRAMNLSAVWRSVNLIASAIASLPLKTYREDNTGARVQVASIFDNPAGPDSHTTRFEWLETITAHLALHGNAYLIKVLNNAGVLVALHPVHPLAVSVELKDGHKFFDISLVDGTKQKLTEVEVLHIPALSMDGKQGIGVLQAARESFGVALAGETAAGKMFAQGAFIGGLVTPEGDEDLTPEDVTFIKASLDANVQGFNNTGALAVINRALKISPWTITAEQAQFLASRAFQIEEVARWFGISPHLLMHTEKQSSWGTGIAEQNLAFARYSLYPYARRMESRFSALLQNPRWVEFDFAGLERPTPQQELDLLMAQVNQGLLSLNEARSKRNLPPVDNGDELRVPSGVMLLSQLAAAKEATEAATEATEEPPQTDPSPTDNTEGASDAAA
jgi:HK97 family phage portal protein